MENSVKTVQISEEFKWLFGNDETSKQKREDFVKNFFDLDKIDEILKTKKEG